MQLKPQYGEIRYGVVAVLAKQWVLESARREIDWLSSYAEKVLSAAGVDLYTVSKLLGHADIKMTMRYTQLVPDYLKGNVRVLDLVRTDTKEA